MKDIRNKLVLLLKRYYKHLILACVVLMLLLGGIVINAKEGKEYSIYNDSFEEKQIVVEILGEVKYPGKYLVNENIQIKQLLYLAGGLTDYADTSLINLNDLIQNNDSIYIRKSLYKSNRLNINIASIDQLMTLPGIGQTKAENIVLYRIINGSFNTLSDLLKVDGITNKIILELIDEITLS